MSGRLFANPNAVREPYPLALRELMSVAKAQESRRWLSPWFGLRAGPTPLWDMKHLAQQLGLAQVSIKDESVRSTLASFKVLGAPIALVRLILKRLPNARHDGVLRGAYSSALADLVVVSATDGNHGRALAAAAQSAGVRCAIVLHEHVSREREDAIAAFGAEIIRVAGHYDAAVKEAARLARQNGWQVVSDTSYEGYEDIPRDVMQGYATIADEIFEQLGNRRPVTHLMVQGGVGGLAAGVLSYFCETSGEHRPTCLVVEPLQADCLMQSAIEGAPARATGSVDSLMAGLACGETSPLAWRFLERSVDFFLTIEDADASSAMRVLAMGETGDVPVVSGESGVAGFAALQVLCADEELRQRVGLDARSHVLLINTEGATAPALYEQLAGRSADAVLASQLQWSQ